MLGSILYHFNGTSRLKIQDVPAYGTVGHNGARISGFSSTARWKGDHVSNNNNQGLHYLLLYCGPYVSTVSQYQYTNAKDAPLPPRVELFWVIADHSAR